MKSYDVCECGAPLRLMERPTPKPAGTEILLKVIAAGVCHSDLHIWEGHYDLGGGKTLQPVLYALAAERILANYGPNNKHREEQGERAGEDLRH